MEIKNEPLILSTNQLVKDLTAHEIWSRDVASLQRTIYKIKNLPPAMGSKWQTGMIRYYESRLAELGLREPIE